MGALYDEASPVHRGLCGPGMRGSRLHGCDRY